MIKTILLIDKDAASVLALETALKEVAPATRLLSVKTAEEAHEILADLQPDLLFFDSNDCNSGRQSFETVMSLVVSRTIPIVMHSHSRNPTHIAWAYSHGATLFFKKPSHYQVLVMGLRKVLETNWDQTNFPAAYSSGASSFRMAKSA